MDSKQEVYVGFKEEGERQIVLNHDVEPLMKFLYGKQHTIICTDCRKDINPHIEIMHTGYNDTQLLYVLCNNCFQESSRKTIRADTQIELKKQLDKISSSLQKKLDSQKFNISGTSHLWYKETINLLKRELSLGALL